MMIAVWVLFQPTLSAFESSQPVGLRPSHCAVADLLVDLLIPTWLGPKDHIVWFFGETVSATWEVADTS